MQNSNKLNIDDVLDDMDVEESELMSTYNEESLDIIFESIILYSKSINADKVAEFVLGLQKRLKINRK